jgi:hypothetical protein
VQTVLAVYAQEWAAAKDQESLGDVLAGALSLG